MHTVHLPITDLLQRHQLQGLFAEEVVLVQVNLDCEKGGVQQEGPSQALGPELRLLCKRSRERRAGAIPRNPTATRQARVSTTARTRMPIRLKDCRDVEALRLGLGPATQRSVALRRLPQPGSTRAPSSHRYYLCH